MNGHKRLIQRQTRRSAFTLTEMLLVVMVIGVLASTVLFALYGASQEAKVSRTRTQIARIHELLMSRWETYATRPIRVSGAGLSIPDRFTDANHNTIYEVGEPLLVDLNKNLKYDGNSAYGATIPNSVAALRVNALRELMRLELPDRVTDVVNPATYGSPNGLPLPSLARQYWQRSSGTSWAANPAHQGAECLYMIIASINDNGRNGLEFFTESEIGDTDGDGMPEILDAWGHPIEFLRWAPGFIADPGPDGQWGKAGVDDDGNGIVDDFPERDPLGTKSYSSDDRPGLTSLMSGETDTSTWEALSPDPFDPLRVYPGSFGLFPLIFSAGPDGKYDIATDTVSVLDYSTLVPANNPYYMMDPGSPPKPVFPMGTPMDADGDGELAFLDNITNHALGAK